LINITHGNFPSGTLGTLIYTLIFTYRVKLLHGLGKIMITGLVHLERYDTILDSLKETAFFLILIRIIGWILITIHFINLAVLLT
jgi:hypothetical protein